MIPPPPKKKVREVSRNREACRPGLHTWGGLTQKGSGSETRGGHREKVGNVGGDGRAREVVEEGEGP